MTLVATASYFSQVGILHPPSFQIALAIGPFHHFVLRERVETNMILIICQADVTKTTTYNGTISNKSKNRNHYIDIFVLCQADITKSTKMIPFPTNLKIEKWSRKIPSNPAVCGCVLPPLSLRYFYRN